MGANLLRFLLLFVLALLVGTMFGIWIGFNPSSLSAAAYVELQQNAIRSLNTVLPAMGAACILFAAVLAVLSKGNALSRNLLLAAIVLLIVAALITRFGNQPINAVVITWSAQALPANWVELRDHWWQLHVARTAAAMAALGLSILAVLMRRSAGNNIP